MIQLLVGDARLKYMQLVHCRQILAENIIFRWITASNLFQLHTYE